jgi:trimeric autotransporter adhesin
VVQVECELIFDEYITYSLDYNVDSIGHSVNPSFMTTILSNDFSVIGVITTVAGDGSQYFGGDNGQATSAGLGKPTDVAVDALGNIYIADFLNDRIRKVTKSTGVITTVAGDGSFYFGGDNGQAVSAALRRPSGVAFDALGNTYIADSGYHRIRKITKSTGVITTVAGTGSQGYSGDKGQATSAELNNPYGVAVDASGNIYIADNSNHRIRMVTNGTGVITTVAGNGSQGYSGDSGQATSAALYSPPGVAVDASGNIYIADFYNNRIRKVTKSTGVITTVAGTGRGSYGGDKGQATSANLRSPYGIAVDASGNIYIADCFNHCIRLVTKSTGVITTVAGTGSQGYSGDKGQATSAELNFPQGVAVDASGRVYIADQSNRIRMIEATELPTTAPSVAPSSTSARSAPPTSTSARSAAPISTFAPSTAPTSTASPSPIPATSLIATKSTTSSTAFSTKVLPGVIGGVGGFLLILFILAVICCCRRR